jgi:hypothetical protein
LRPTASSILKQRRFIPTDDARADQWNDFGSPADTDAHARAQLVMPQRINLHEAGLRQSPRLKELADNKPSKEKGHVIWVSKVTKIVTLLLVFSFVRDVSLNLPSYNISPEATMADKTVAHFHEVNELYNGTLNAIHSYAFSAIAIERFDLHKNYAAAQLGSIH